VESSTILSKMERRQHGKVLREKCPRNAHGEWKPRSKSQDIIKLLEESDVDRIPGLISVKYQRMAESPFKFFRGGAIIQARDLANAEVSGIIVQACGDCHLMNFGGFGAIRDGIRRPGGTGFPSLSVSHSFGAPADRTSKGSGPGVLAIAEM